jgi:hypothetical protein
MHRRAFRIALILFLTIGTETHDGTLRFISPKQTIVLRTPNKELRVPVQVFIPQHADNRSYLMRCDGACAWSAGQSLNGANEDAIHPLQPIYVPLDDFGLALFTVSVYGAGGRVLKTAEHRVKVCGGEDPCEPF